MPATQEAQHSSTAACQLYGWDGAPVRLGSVGDSLQITDASSQWDLITPTFNATSDVYVFSKSSVTKQTITVNYTDSTKEVLLSVVKVVV